MWARAPFTCLSLASVSMRECDRIHTAISNSKSMKRSVCFLSGGAEPWHHMVHGRWQGAINGGPHGGWAAHHACKKQTTVPIIRSQASVLMRFISKGRLCSSRPGKREQERQRERGGKRLTRCSHRRDDRGPVEVEHSKVGLTTLRPESPCAALFIKSCKDNNES